MAWVKPSRSRPNRRGPGQEGGVTSNSGGGGSSPVGGRSTALGGGDTGLGRSQRRGLRMINATAGLRLSQGLDSPGIQPNSLALAAGCGKRQQRGRCCRYRGLMGAAGSGAIQLQQLRSDIQEGLGKGPPSPLEPAGDLAGRAQAQGLAPHCRPGRLSRGGDCSPAQCQGGYQ